MTPPILPSSADIVVPAVTEIIARRPKTFAKINYGQGIYANIIAGLRAQANLAISRLSEGVVGNNLKLATGEQLLSYVSSEFEEPPSLGPTKAMGICFFDRFASTGGWPAGVIPKGHKFRRDPTPDAPGPLTAWDYQVASDTPIGLGVSGVFVPIISIREGANGNTPALVNYFYADLTNVDKLFDKDLKPAVYSTAGGSSGLDDEDIRRYARAFAIGQYGPTDDALILAALRTGLGVKRVVISGRGVYVTDASWGYSAPWVAAVKQAMLDSGGLGYATRFDVNPIFSFPVAVSLSIRLRDTSYLSDTTDIDIKVRAAVQSYLDDRDDFYVVSTDSLRAVVSKADNRILRCTAATINNLDGTPYVATGIAHAYLANKSTSLSYLPPV